MDEFYIRKILKGDSDSFRYFIEKYKGFAFSLAFVIVKNTVLAEDVVQESFVKAFQKLNTFRNDSSFKTWLARIVINNSLRQVEKKSTGDYLTGNISDEEIEVVNGSLHTLTSEERKYYITLVFTKLLYNEALSLELFYLKEYSIAEISEMTGWSASKIKMLLLRGRKNAYVLLKKLLKSEIKEIL